jgi:hypothetical protein
MGQYGQKLIQGQYHDFVVVVLVVVCTRTALSLLHNVQDTCATHTRSPCRNVNLSPASLEMQADRETETESEGAD